MNIEKLGVAWVEAIYLVIARCFSVVVLRNSINYHGSGIEHGTCINYFNT